MTLQSGIQNKTGLLAPLGRLGRQGTAVLRPALRKENVVGMRGGARVGPAVGHGVIAV